MTNSASSPVRVAAVVLNWNASAQTLRAVRELLSWQRLCPKIFIVDNASAPEDRLHLSSLAGSAALLFQSANLGYAGGNNVGIEAALQAQAEAVLLLNNDAYIDEEDAMKLVKVLTEHADAGIVGPVLREIQPDGRAVDTAGGRNIALFPHTRRALRNRSPAPLLDVCYVPGTAALVRSEVFRRIGLFDRDFFFSGEMADLCARAKTAGFRCVIFTEAQAQHRKESAAPTMTALHAYYTLRNRFLYARKHAGRLAMLLRAYWILLGWVSWGSAALKGNPEMQRAIRLALSDGWNEHWGPRNDVFLSKSNGGHP
jgi:GT2 family glycosyltransferase